MKPFTSVILAACAALAGCGGKSKPAPEQPTLADTTTEPAPDPAATTTAPDTAPVPAPEPEPTPMTDAEIEGLLQEMVAMMTRIDKAAATKSCDKVAAALDYESANSKAFFEKSAKASKTDQKRAEELMTSKGYDKQIEAATQSLGAIASKCANHAGFNKALEQFGGSMEGAAPPP